MATTNPVFQVLTTSGDQALLAAGSRVDALNNGQLGIFNYHTGLSIDGTVPGDARDIFIAVGINRTTGGTDDMEDFNKSAGQLIQVRNAKSRTAKATVDEIAKVIELTGFTANCDSDYALRLTFLGQKIYGMNGYNGVAKTFNYHTGCCSDPCGDGCGDGNPVELAFGLAANINADPDLLVAATIFGNKITAVISTAPTADGNTVVTVGTTTYTVAVLDADTTAQAAQKIVDAINTQTGSPYRASLTGSTISIYEKAPGQASTATFAVTGSGVAATGIVASTKTAVTDEAAFKAAYPGASVILRLTSAIEVRKAVNGGINLGYHKAGINFEAHLVDGFVCNGTLTTITEFQFREGSGYDLQQLEYVAGGWNGKPGPYRQSTTTGMARDGIEYFTSVSAKYNVLSLTYDQFSVGGWLEYLNNLETIIAIPCADTTTLTGLVAVLDLIFTQFQPLANDVASMDCTNSRTGLLAANVNGIQALS
jgi:hypothetical protein